MPAAAGAGRTRPAATGAPTGPRARLCPGPARSTGPARSSAAAPPPGRAPLAARRRGSGPAPSRSGARCRCRYRCCGAVPFVRDAGGAVPPSLPIKVVFLSPPALPALRTGGAAAAAARTMGPRLPAARTGHRHRPRARDRGTGAAGGPASPAGPRGAGSRLGEGSWGAPRRGPVHQEWGRRRVSAPTAAVEGQRLEPGAGMSGGEVGRAGEGEVRRHLGVSGEAVGMLGQPHCWGDVGGRDCQGGGAGWQPCPHGPRVGMGLLLVLLNPERRSHHAWWPWHQAGELHAQPGQLASSLCPWDTEAGAPHPLLVFPFLPFFVPNQKQSSKWHLSKALPPERLHLSPAMAENSHGRIPRCSSTGAMDCSYPGPTVAVMCTRAGLPASSGHPRSGCMGTP